MVNILSLLLLLGILPTTQGQSPVNISWDSASHSKGQECTILIGDQARVVLTVATHLGTQIHFPSMDEYGSNGIIPLRQWRDSIYMDNGQLLQRQITVVTCFEPGDHVIKGLHTKWKDARNGINSVRASDSLVLHVRDVGGVDTTNQIKDIADVFHEPLTAWEFLRWPLLLILILVACLLIRYSIRRRKERKQGAKEEQAEDKESYVNPRKQALAELQKLDSQHIWQGGNVKEYYMQLTNIVRKYLKKRYQIDSTEMPSDETLEAFSDCEGFTHERDMLLRKMLRTADMVKFAKAKPTTSEHEQSMQNAVAFVEADPYVEEEPGQPAESRSESSALSETPKPAAPPTPSEAPSDEQANNKI